MKALRSSPETQFLGYGYKIAQMTQLRKTPPRCSLSEYYRNGKKK
jgi:hypothetical protein